MKICWLTNYYSPYKMNVCELIGQKIELTTLMLGGKEDENRNDEWVLNENRSFRVELINKDFLTKIKKLAKENDILLDSMYSTKYGILAVNAFKREHKKVVFLADGGLAIDRGQIINNAISFIMKRHDYFLSSSEITDRYFKFYHVDENKILHYRFSSLFRKDIENNRKLVSNKKEIREKLGIDTKFTFISVGQPIERKGFDILLESYVKTGLTDKMNLYIVGGEPQNKIKQMIIDNQLNNVHFIGLLNSSDLAQYYAASDAFVLCTREDIWGLVIHEAMSYGLPVITSDKCVAGLHFSKMGNNTIICGVNDIDDYARQMKSIYENKEKTSMLSKKALEVCAEYTIENNAKDIIEILKML